MDRLYREHNIKKVGFDEMTMLCIMNQILPEAISQQILIQETRPDGTMKEITYEGLKSGALAFLNAMPGGTI